MRVLCLELPAPSRLEIGEPGPLWLVAVAIKVTTVPNLPEQRSRLKPAVGAHNRTGANLQQLGDAFEAGVALASPSVVMFE
jgi:hypothetical protein